MNIQQGLAKLIEGESLSNEDMIAVMRQIMTGEASEAQIAGFLVALRMKGETVDEISGAATVMRELATPVDLQGEHLVDIVGTGGDGASIFNVSTASTFVVAAAGGMVAKHGNRSVSSKSGAADVLEAAGVSLQLSAAQVKQCVESLGVGFMFAVNHHSAMKHAIGPRKQLAVRTVFNLLGPITNPANTPNQLLGVFDAQWLRPIADVLNKLGSRRVLVVHSDDGLDEISIAAPTRVAELDNGSVKEYTIEPEDFGIARGSLDSLVVADAGESLALIQSALRGEPGPARDIIALNAGAALYAAHLSESLADGVSKAGEILASGAAADKMQQLADLSQTLAAGE